MNTRKEITTINVDGELWRQLKIYCAVNGMKQSGIIEQLVKEFLAKEKTLQKK